MWRRQPGKSATAAPFVKGRDFWVDEVLPKYLGQIVTPVSVDAEHPLFLMYTSGSTANPRDASIARADISRIDGNNKVHSGSASGRCVLVYG